MIFIHHGYNKEFLYTNPFNSISMCSISHKFIVFSKVKTLIIMGKEHMTGHIVLLHSLPKHKINDSWKIT